MPAEVLQDHAGAHDPQSATDPERGRQQPDASGDLLAWKLVADDAKGEREDAAGGALERAPHDHDRQ